MRYHMLSECAKNPDIKLMTSRTNLARLLEAKGDYEGAEPMYHKGGSSKLGRLPLNSAENVRFRNEMIFIYKKKTTK